MTEHYTKSTVSATSFCKKCGSFTLHRIDGGRVGPCIPCMGKLEAEHQERVSAAAAPTRVGLFGGPVAAAPGRGEESAESKEAKEARARAAALKHAAKSTLDLFSATAEPVAAAPPASSPIAEQPVATKPRYIVEQELELAEVHAFVEACTAVGFEYRGYANANGDRVYDYSRRGVPENVFLLRASKWDRTPAMLEREAQKVERWL